MALTFLLCTYQALSIGIAATPRLPKWRAVLHAAWIEGTTTFTQLSGQPTGSIRNRHWQQVAILAVVFAIAFVSLRFLHFPAKISASISREILIKSGTRLLSIMTSIGGRRSSVLPATYSIISAFSCP